MSGKYHPKAPPRYGSPGAKQSGGSKIYWIFLGTMLLAVVSYSVLLNRISQTILPETNFMDHHARSLSTAPKLLFNPFDIVEEQAPNLPSVRVADADLEARRDIYGGRGDKKHLGGFTDIDMQGISPWVWKHMVRNWTVQSVLDVGCGRGISTTWFSTHGLKTQCVEGSHDAIEQSMLPDKSLVVEHDFSRGPWWPGDTFDVAWAVEFLEHVNVQHQFNYVSAFRKAAVLMVTSSFWGGWHHVEIHSNDWWIRKYEAYGFVYSESLTQEIRKVADEENLLSLKNETFRFPPNGEVYCANHMIHSMKVFINPRIAAMPQHAHLFGEFGCYDSNKPPPKNRECAIVQNEGVAKDAATETALDPAFYPLNLTDAMDEAWHDIVRKNLHRAKPSEPDTTRSKPPPEKNSVPKKLRTNLPRGKSSLTTTTTTKSVWDPKTLSWQERPN